MALDNTIIVAGLMVASGGLGYLIDRWLRKSAGNEDADSIVKTVELKRLLEAEGISFADAQALRDSLYSGREIITPKIVQAIEASGSEDESHSRPIDFSDTTIGMKLGMSNRLSELDGQIDYAMAELLTRFSEARQIALHDSHEAWVEFRAREAEVAGLAWEGGTGAPLLGLSRMVELSEQRLADIRRMKDELDEL